LRGDPTRVRQILLNFGSNAVKFTDNGTVKIVVDYLPDSQHIGFAVVDSGIGMNSDQIEKIFRPFEQADSTTTRQYGGTGLGLTLSRQLTEMMGGNLTVSSVPGRGSRFYATIAVGNLNNTTMISSYSDIMKTHHVKQPGPESRQLYGEVLIAEDNENNQKLFSLFLKKMGSFRILLSNVQGWPLWVRPRFVWFLKTRGVLIYRDRTIKHPSGKRKTFGRWSSRPNLRSEHSGDNRILPPGLYILLFLP